MSETSAAIPNKRQHTKKKSGLENIWKRMKKNRMAMVGLAVIVFMVLVALFADIIADYGTQVIAQSRDRMEVPSVSHWFGTDHLGRDILARIVHGARYSLSLGIGITIISMSLGCMVGAACGYYGGILDSIVMRIADMFLSMPRILLTLALVAALGTNTLNLVAAMTISALPAYIRVMRSYILTVIGQEYIEAARACGMNDFRIIVSHILPNVIGPIVVEATMSVSDTILSIAALSFLGMGIQPPTPEWGAMLSESQSYMVKHPIMIVVPGLCIALTSLSLNLMGDGLRDAIDPRLKD